MPPSNTGLDTDLCWEKRVTSASTPGTCWPSPIDKALRAMEDNLIDTLDLKKGAEVLDAGCGIPHVAIHLAEQGFFVQGIDTTEHHVVKAQQNIEVRKLEEKVKVMEGDYHRLDMFAGESFDGAHTMETFVHATEPEIAAAELFRVLRPGGRLAMYEYDHVDFNTQSKEVGGSWAKINKDSAIPAFDRFQQGVLEHILEEAGFEDVSVKDLSENIAPMMRHFYLLAFIPYHMIAWLGLKNHFINTVAGYEGWVYRDAVRYIAVSAKKPLVAGQAPSGEIKKTR